MSRVFGADTARAIGSTPYPAQYTNGLSGQRELHNETRRYFDLESQASFPVCRMVAALFQDADVVTALADHFGALLEGTYVRIEYAADTDGFWLEPHTDLGVKKLTIIYYLSDDPAHIDLGTDIYRSQSSHFGCVPFIPDTALVFTPSTNTWHGFEPRPISGVRKSLIINYVGREWRDRSQLSFPHDPVSFAQADPFGCKVETA